MTARIALHIAAACALSMTGLVVVWRAWAGKARPRLAALLAAGAWGLSTMLWVQAFGAEIGTALALETASLLAFAFLFTRMEWQPARPPRRIDHHLAARTAPEKRSTDRSTDARYVKSVGVVARIAVGGPLALAAALSLGLMLALRAPLHEQTRLILGGLAVPTLWASTIIITLALRRIWPTALALSCVVAVAAVTAWVSL